MQPHFSVGAYDDEGPPVPIPNTVVKLIRAENTWREAAWKDRSVPTLTNRSPNRAVGFFVFTGLPHLDEVAGCDGP